MGAENIKMWFENALNQIDPIEHSEIDAMIRCGYDEFKEYSNHMKAMIVELHKILAEKNDEIKEQAEEIQDLINQLTAYEDVILP